MSKRDLFEALLVANEVECDVSIISSGFNEGVEFRRTRRKEISIGDGVQCREDLQNGTMIKCLTGNLYSVSIVLCLSLFSSSWQNK